MMMKGLRVRSVARGDGIAMTDSVLRRRLHSVSRSWIRWATTLAFGLATSSAAAEDAQQTVENYEKPEPSQDFHWHIGLGVSAAPYVALGDADKVRLYVGAMLLPDIKVSYSMGSDDDVDRVRFYLGMRWVGLSAGGSLTQAQVQGERASDIEAIGNLGFMFRLFPPRASTRSPVSSSLTWFTVGGFGGTVKTKKDEIVAGGGLIFGLEVDAIAFNFGP